MISQFRLENFKGHRDTTLNLSRFTMLVGDNGSGKTSVLEALELQSAILRNQPAFPWWRGEPDDWRRRGAGDTAKLSSSGPVLDHDWSTTMEFAFADGRPDVTVNGKRRSHSTGRSQTIGYGDRELQSFIEVARLYRFEPAKVAASAYSDVPGTPVEADGTHTAVALAALKLGDDEAFDRIEDHLRTLVPSVERIRIRPAEAFRADQGDKVVGSKLYFDFRGAPGVPAHHASHGTLVAVALLTALLGPGRPGLVLLDDFDHALHPRAQMELVRMLQRLLELEDFRQTQIVATTHSPYVLDELPPSSIIAFALRDDGTVASKPLSAHPDAAKTRGALRSGELWSLEAERNWVLGR